MATSSPTKGVLGLGSFNNCSFSIVELVCCRKVVHDGGGLVCVPQETTSTNGLCLLNFGTDELAVTGRPLEIGIPVFVANSSLTSPSPRIPLDASERDVEGREL
jgi:hypothetical protein